MNFNFLSSLLSGILYPLLSLLSPLIKDELNTFIQSLYKKAVVTSSPWDDFVIKILADILSIDLSSIQVANTGNPPQLNVPDGKASADVTIPKF